MMFDNLKYLGYALVLKVIYSSNSMPSIMTLYIVLHMYIVIFAEQVGLNEYILDYQPLTYSTIDLHTKHQRVRRSLDSHLHLHFQAYGR